MMQQAQKTALDLLGDTKIITSEMLEAGHRYAEICHLNPTRSPSFPSSSRAFAHSTYGKKQEKRLELIWRELHQILKQSPVGAIIKRLTVDNDIKVLPWIYQNKAAQHLVKEALGNLVFCLKGHGQL